MQAVGKAEAGKAGRQAAWGAGSLILTLRPPWCLPLHQLSLPVPAVPLLLLSLAVLGAGGAPEPLQGAAMCACFCSQPPGGGSKAGLGRLLMAAWPKQV